MSLRVLAPGPLALVQDLGRPGHAAVGVGRSGAADRGALRLANRLLGGPEDAAALEVLLGGLVVQAQTDLLVALTGAPAPADVDGRPQGHAALLRLRAGAVLRLGTPPEGLRTYLGVRGGLVPAPVLGSRASDTLSGLGPPPVRAGDVLPVGPVGPQHGPLLVEQAPVALPRRDVLPVLPGPRADWAARPLDGTAWTVAAASDRVALRLDGPPLPRAHPGELPSEGLLPGAVQLPPDGRPVLFLADAPVTGGYPVVAVVPAAALDRAAQLRPGERLRFTQLPGRLV